MRWFLYAVTILAVVGLAIWAYDQNHQTQLVNDELGDLRREIVRLREAISVQHAEWAYLNRPERLMRLADMNFAELQLVPIEGHQFGRIGDIGLTLATATPVDPAAAAIPSEARP